MDDKARKALDRLEAQCARREYCCSDILRKAAKALEGDTETAQEILDSLVKNGFVNDLRYAAAFAREKSGLTGWGPVKIRFALKTKGIPADIVETALQEVEPGHAENRLEKLMRGKWKNLEGDPQARLKLLKFALGRGYEYDTVREMADKICKDG